MTTPKITIFIVKTQIYNKIQLPTTNYLQTTAVLWKSVFFLRKYIYIMTRIFQIEDCWRHNNIYFRTVVLARKKWGINLYSTVKKVKASHQKMSHAFHTNSK